MTWDGQPEHRGLRKGEPLDPQERAAHLRRIIEASGRTEPPRTPTPAVPGMPPDPFSGTLPGAIAQAEMLRSLVEGGMTEPQALYYLACLVQVGLAMRLGTFNADVPPWPEAS